MTTQTERDRLNAAIDREIEALLKQYATPNSKPYSVPTQRLPELKAKVAKAKARHKKQLAALIGEFAGPPPKPTPAEQARALNQRRLDALGRRKKRETRRNCFLMSRYVLVPAKKDQLAYQRPILTLRVHCGRYWAVEVNEAGEIVDLTASKNVVPYGGTKRMSYSALRRGFPSETAVERYAQLLRRELAKLDAEHAEYVAQQAKAGKKAKRTHA